MWPTYLTKTLPSLPLNLETSGSVSGSTPKRGLGAWWGALRKSKVAPSTTSTIASDTEPKEVKSPTPSTSVKVIGPHLLRGTVWTQSARKFLEDNEALSDDDLDALPPELLDAVLVLSNGSGVSPTIMVHKMVVSVGERFLEWSLGQVVRFYVNNFYQPVK